jgi:ribonuclease VapC
VGPAEVIVDSSALLAILFQEPEASEFAVLLLSSNNHRISAVNWLEAAINADRRGDETTAGVFETLCDRLRIGIEPVRTEHAWLARSAYATFGRGRHPARLNLGDCFAYALAKATGEPLLFKGEDFRATDVTPAL